MAALPSPTQVAGGHNAIYEAYYQQIDPNCQGKIEASDAAKFLKKSQLSDVILSRVWDLSDPGRKGYLNKNGFFVALKLCSLAQSGRDLSMVNVTTDSPPPKMGELPKLPPQKPSAPPVINNSMISSDWAIKPAEKAKYDQLFNSLQPVNGMIAGNKVKGVLMESKLPLDILGKIWDLADMDKDGMLDHHEFTVAMHLVYKALGKFTIPNVLPPELLPRKEPQQFAAFPTSIPIVSAPPPVIPTLPTASVMRPEVPKPLVPSLPPTPWVVTADERTKYDVLFHQTDVDKDGFVSGLEIKDVFLRSGVPQPVLAHIWGLCDIKQSGKLNSEQFALSMWLINQTLQGHEPPASLAPDMVPPSLRATKPAPEAVVENNNAPYSNPELDMITRDIEELAREKRTLETDIAQKEADIGIKHGEIKSLQSELDTLAATLKQLENQKGEAQKRLNDLKGQVDNLRRQADEQEVSLKAQEDELGSKKQELESLKQEEASLEMKQKDSHSQLDGLTKNLQDTQLQISQAKAKITHLQEQSRQMSDAIATCDSALTSGDPTSVADTCLAIEPEFTDPEVLKLALLNGGSPTTHNAADNKADAFSNLNGPAQNGRTGFGNDDFFHNDPFKNGKQTADPFSASDPFAAAFPAQATGGFNADPFNSFGTPAKNDPFDPFGDGKNRGGTKSPADMSGKDPFGCDPFAILHAPTSAGPPPRPESPSPALPPKKSKQPPPRPAPPRPSQQPVRPAPSPDPGADPFTNGGDPFRGGAFTDFADFDKFTDTKDQVIEPKLPTKPRLEFTEDPFRNYRYEDPFDIADPFDDDPPAVSNGVKVDAFGMKPRSNGTEDQQLVWAAAEGIRLEEERRRKVRQEQDDFEYALALSKADKSRAK